MLTIIPPTPQAYKELQYTIKSKDPKTYKNGYN